MTEQTTSTRQQISSMSKDEFLAAHKKPELIAAAETAGVEDTSGTKSDIYDRLVAQYDLPDPALRGESETESPVATTWRIADEMRAEDPEVRRKDIQAACEEAGVAHYTARTQIQAWHKATSGGERRVTDLDPADLPKALRPAEPAQEEGADDES